MVCCFPKYYNYYTLGKSRYWRRGEKIHLCRIVGVLGTLVPDKRAKAIPSESLTYYLLFILLYFFILLWQNTSGNNLRGEIICFGSQFQRYHSIISESAWQSKAVWIMVARLQSKGDTGRNQGKIQPQEHTHSKLPPLTRPHLLKFLEPSKIVPLAGYQNFNTWTCGGHFIFKS
jgi:hypothetical protein